jgi:hypothetical protein
MRGSIYGKEEDDDDDDAEPPNQIPWSNNTITNVAET